MNYILSIIIPTKDRYKYLLRTVQNLAELETDKVEIIIQDNTADNSSIKELLKKLNRNNIKYFHDNSNLSQTGNSELALSHATGEYCCYIGDDDTVMPEILSMVEKIKAKGYGACICDAARFYWPDVVFEKKRPWLKYNTKQYKMKELNAKSELQKTMSYGMQDIERLPRVYHGIVSKKILDKIKQITGSFFPGPSPDMANAVACSLLIDKYVYTEMPLIFSGVGYTSGAGMGQRGAHRGALKNAKQLPVDAEEKWSSRIPKVWLGYTVWAESAEKALIAMGYEDKVKEINITAMEAKIFLKYGEYRKMILERIKDPFHLVAFLIECIRFVIKYIIAEGKIKIRKIRGLVVLVDRPLLFEDAFKEVRNANKSMVMV